MTILVRTLGMLCAAAAVVACTSAPGDVGPPAPGTLLTRADLASPVGAGHRIRYVSRDVRGAPVEVTGAVLVPEGPAPPGGRPVLALAHGTVGIADACAPSTAPPGSGTELERLAEPFLGRGWVVAATDYQGLGTPGVHPYLVARAAAHDVLDSVRAAARLPDSEVEATSAVLVFGHSQGGQAAAATAELAPSYAPELDVRGAVAGAAATELMDSSTEPVLDGPLLGFTMMVHAGFLAAYPDLPAAALVTSAGAGRLPEVEQGCLGEVLDRFAEADADALLAPPGSLTGTGWPAAFADATPGSVRTPVPVLTFHGTADDVVPTRWSAAYRDRACAAGSSVTRVVYPGADHGSVVGRALPGALDWLTERLDGAAPAAGSCTGDQPG